MRSRSESFSKIKTLYTLLHARISGSFKGGHDTDLLKQQFIYKSKQEILEVERVELTHAIKKNA